MQAELVIQNPQATMPLRISLEVDCNTPEKKILANVLANSRRIKQWVNTVPAHERVAVLVGSGPSLVDTLDELKTIGGDVFALNRAAAHLDSKGVYPDYQVIMDAQPATADLVGPAKKHLFASQVDPACFDKVPGATLWHATHGAVMVDEQDGFPDHSDYVLIGGAVSVGNTALVLLYTLGYRTIYVFGMDSSHKDGASHAFQQDMNAGDPCTIVKFDGQEYVCSLTMSLQAKHFMLRASQLKAAGATIEVHGSGLLPHMYRTPLSEADKYRQIWEHEDYRTVAPGELCADKFLKLIPRKSSVIDFGCGTGRGSLKIEQAGHLVTMVDFADNCRDEAAEHITFVRADLTKPLYLYGEYGFCTDVMEHIPTQDVEAVIRNIMDAAATTYFQISTVPDNMGALVGHALHLTVKPHEWWRDLFISMGYSIHHEEKESICSSFLVKKEIVA